MMSFVYVNRSQAHFAHVIPIVHPSKWMAILYMNGKQGQAHLFKGHN